MSKRSIGARPGLLKFGVDAQHAGPCSLSNLLTLFPERQFNADFLVLSQQGFAVRFKVEDELLRIGLENWSRLDNGDSLGKTRKLGGGVRLERMDRADLPDKLRPRAAANRHWFTQEFDIG